MRTQLSQRLVVFAADMPHSDKIPWNFVLSLPHIMFLSHKRVMYSNSFGFSVHSLLYYRLNSQKIGEVQMKMLFFPYHLSIGPCVK